MTSKGAVTMTTRIEVTKKLKNTYKTATKQEKTQILTNFCETTGLSRSTARRYLTSPTLGNPKIHRIDRRQTKPRKYSTDTRKVLTHIWRLQGAPCGKYMAANMAQWLTALEKHKELTKGKKGYSTAVKKELLAMSGATIDRYLKEERDKFAIKGISTTKPGALLRNSIQIRTATDEIDQEPGFFEVDTVAHCGPTLKGEFARTLSMTDVHTGWIHLEVLRNNAAVHVIGGLDRALEAIPYGIEGIDCDNGSEFINNQVMTWAVDKQVFFTRARPYRKNDQAHIESKNNHVVRKFGFHLRYDTETEREILALLWQQVCLKMNFFTPTRKPIGWTMNAHGRRRRVYDQPATPYQRLLDSQVLSRAQQRELKAQHNKINPAQVARDIYRYQKMLSEQARTKTEVMVVEIAAAQDKREKRYEGGIKIRTS